MNVDRMMDRIAERITNELRLYKLERDVKIIKWILSIVGREVTYDYKNKRANFNG